MIRRLVNLKYNDGSSVAKYLSNFQGQLNELSTMKLELDDEVQTLLLLSSLPDNWETLVASLSNSAPNGVTTVNMVKDSMFNEETRRKELSISFNTKTLVIEKWERSKNRKPSSDYNHDKSRGKSKSRKEMKCFIMASQGTLKESVENSKKEQFKGKDEEQKQDKDITVVASNGDTIIVCDDVCVNLACQDST